MRRRNEKCKFKQKCCSTMRRKKWEQENYSEKAFNLSFQRAFSLAKKWEAKRNLRDGISLALVDKPRNVYESLTI